MNVPTDYQVFARLVLLFRLEQNVSLEVEERAREPLKLVVPLARLPV
jgi:hypothetical protein